ncbi:FadR/GntR family transcriptional regulator [Trueperella sp. LYQ143]|uniref:FadR/GntR family transcriptional regulator n=1 Tax=unclassified Trueperella TaxID=2630174 RepID=UPI003983415C
MAYGDGPQQKAAKLRKHPVVDAIKNLILERGLQSGELLPSESDLVELLGVSRASIREAIKVLATLDIVEVRRGTGTYVGNMSLQPMVESLTFRSAQTPLGGLVALRDVLMTRWKLDEAYAPMVVAKLEHRTNDDIRQTIADMEESFARQEPIFAADRAFHLILAKLTNSLLFVQLLEAFWDVEKVVMNKLRKPTQDEIRYDITLHHQLLECGERGDVSGYLRALAEHYSRMVNELPIDNYFPEVNEGHERSTDESKA